MGRPTKIDKIVIGKLEEVFALGGNDDEACFYAGIAPETLYYFQKMNPYFAKRKAALKQRPILKARQTVVHALSEPDTARWFLERKRKNEFSLRTEHSLPDGQALGVVILPQIQSRKGEAKELGNGTVDSLAADAETN